MPWNSNIRVDLSQPFDPDEFAKIIGWFAEKQYSAKFSHTANSSCFRFTLGDKSHDVIASIDGGRAHTLFVVFNNDLDLATEFKLAF